MDQLDPQGYFTIKDFGKKSIFAKVIEKYQLYDTSKLDHFYAVKRHIILRISYREIVYENPEYDAFEIIVKIIKLNKLNAREIIKYITGVDLIEIIADNIDYINEKHWHMSLLVRNTKTNNIIRVFKFINKLAYQRKLKEHKKASITAFIEACKGSLDYTNADHVDVPKNLIMQLNTNNVIKQKIVIILDVRGRYTPVIKGVGDCYVILKIGNPGIAKSFLNITYKGIRTFNGPCCNKITIFHREGQMFYRLDRNKIKITIKKIIPFDGSDYELYPGCFTLIRCDS